MRPTLVLVRHLEIGGRAFTHGSELPRDLLTEDEVGKLLDSGRLAEYPERRSLFRLFSVFSGAKEKEPLDRHELTAYALPE